MSKHRAKINKWNSGVGTTPRGGSLAKEVVNFDVFSHKNKIIPFYGVQDGDDSSSTHKKQNFEIAYNTGISQWVVYGLGINTTADIKYKKLSFGGTFDLGDDSWFPASSQSWSQSSSGTPNYNMLIYYPTTGKLYGYRASRYIWAATPDDSTAWNDTSKDLNDYSEFGTTFTYASEGFVHPADKILYCAFDRHVISNNNGSWSSGVLFSVPTNFHITDMCAYGNYLAIAAAPDDGVGDSYVYFWDRNTSNAIATEVVSFKEGVLEVIDVISGVLVGISISNRTSGTTIRKDDRIIVNKYNGTPEAVQVEELIFETAGATRLSNVKQKKDGRLHFLLEGVFNGSQREGVWSVGTSNSNPSGFSIVREQNPNNNTAPSSVELLSFIYAGDYLFQAYTDGGVYKVTKTAEGGAYLATSIYETGENPEMREEHMGKTKQLLGVRLYFDEITSGDSIKISYSVDGGSEKEIFTNTTVGDFVKESTVDVDKENLGKGTKFNFKIESIGVSVWDLEYYYTIIESQL